MPSYKITVVVVGVAKIVVVAVPKVVAAAKVVVVVVVVANKIRDCLTFFPLVCRAIHLWPENQTH